MSGAGPSAARNGYHATLALAAVATRRRYSGNASGAPGQHRGAGHRHGPEPVDHPACQVFLQADRGLRGAEGDRLDEDPGQQEVDVGNPVRQRTADRAAEHVDEQQHEQDRLDRGEDQQVRLADEVTQVAAGDHDDVGDGRAHSLWPREVRPQHRSVRRRYVRRGRLGPGAAPGPGARRAAVLAGRGAGQLQEDIVQRGPAQPDVADADLCPAQPGGRLLHQLEPIARGREGETVRALVRLRLAAAHSGEDRLRPVTLPRAGQFDLRERLAASVYSPGMPASAFGGAAGPGLLWPLPWALSFRWADRYS